MDMAKEKILLDKEVRRLVLARLSVLSPDIVISLGAEGSFSRDELIERVESGDQVGEKLAKIQLEWLRSLNQDVQV